ncbi:polysaccharide pyruvyl transferase family protein [Clostridium algidicarnis]|uniref:polysaccharide pyruvyl transferase family protein n=1 Tax=Clostridium algidicarnis TaxID=37659 RepID=UPI003FD6FE6B
MEDRISIYGHYGSCNHGNEAIARGIKELFVNDDINLYSYNPDTDFKYQLDQLFKILPFINNYKRFSIQRIIKGILNRTLKDKSIVYKNMIKPFMQDIGGVYLLEAGDQYCEGGDLRSFYYYLNKQINNYGGKTIMLPATINVSSLEDINLINDLETYSLIYARESITYEGLIKAGLSKNVRYCPDPAFIMNPKVCKLPNLFNERKIVGITIGSLSQGKEMYYDDVYKNTESLISYILNETEYGVALVPHVNVASSLNDSTSLQQLYDKFSSTQRVVLIPEQRADEQKFVIGKCNFMVTLRTHVSVSSYSQAVPTLVLGYSQKSKGIAKDLFGTYDNYVLGVDTLSKKNKLTDSFKWIVKNEALIKQKFDENLDQYINKVYKLYDDINNIKENLDE